MEPVLFYGVPHGCSFGAIVALEWLGQPYRLSRVEMLEARDPAYLDLNPVGATPALLTADGRVINESLAILHHLAAKDLERPLGFAQGSTAFDELNHVLAFLHADFHPVFGTLFQPGKYVDDPAAQANAVDKARAKAAKAYGRLEARLADRPWLAGGRKSVADAYFAGVARWGADLEVFDLATAFPHVHAHLRKLDADPAVAFAHAVEDAALAVSAGGFLGHVTLDELKPRLLAA
jgi:glutathione S-transferase